MQGFSPKLPLQKDDSDGLYSMNKTALESIKQDFKMLLLTNPGERMMIPDYGVGIRALLFSQNNGELSEILSSRIQSQISQYMSFINIKNIQVFGDEINENALNVIINYNIPSLNVEDELNLALISN